MNFLNNKLWREHCHTEYYVLESCQLECLNNKSIFTHIPDWYKWEREEVRKEIRSETYYFEDEVILQHLENAKVGYKYLGKVRFVHDMNGLQLHGKLEDGTNFDFDNDPKNTPSIYFYYNYHKKGIVKPGQALDIETLDDTWFIYLQTKNDVITKIHLADEELYDYSLEKMKLQNYMLFIVIIY